MAKHANHKAAGGRGGSPHGSHSGGATALTEEFFTDFCEVFLKEARLADKEFGAVMKELHRYLDEGEAPVGLATRLSHLSNPGLKQLLTRFPLKQYHFLPASELSGLNAYFTANEMKDAALLPAAGLRWTGLGMLALGLKAGRAIEAALHEDRDTPPPPAPRGQPASPLQEDERQELRRLREERMEWAMAAAQCKALITQLRVVARAAEDALSNGDVTTDNKRRKPSGAN